MYNPDQPRDERGRFGGGGNSPVSEKDRPRNYGRNTPVSARELRAHRLADAQIKRFNVVKKMGSPKKIDRARALHRAVSRGQRLAQRPSGFRPQASKRYEQ